MTAEVALAAATVETMGEETEKAPVAATVKVAPVAEMSPRANLCVSSPSCNSGLLWLRLDGSHWG
jgi:hypothetical protein